MSAAPNVTSLFTELYAELRQLAQRQITGDDTLNTTALVHELYMRLTPRTDLEFVDQRAFFAYAARAMRHLLVDRARSRLRAKRTMPIEILDSADSFEMTVQANDAIEMDDLLKRLAQEDPRSAEVLELHYFAGLTAERIGQHLGIDRRTVHRDLDFAKAFVRAHWPRENC